MPNVLFASVVCVLCFAHREPPANPEADYIRTHAVPFTTVAAGHGFADLAPLKAMIGDARFVGLGEGTHGTREHFQMKHRLLEFFVEELGFSVFSIEASSPESFAVDEFVSSGNGDPAALIGGMYFWTWNTEEVLDMVRWMRAFNERQEKAGSPRRVRFTGFDMQEPSVAAKIVREFLTRAEPAEVGALEAKLAAISEVDRSAATPAQSFGVATGSLPVKELRGKNIRYSGVIRTEDIRGGFAALWLRVDAKDGTVLAFDNMQDRGPRGTTGWAQYSIELPVADEAANINFGVLMPGNGTAWFDSLSFEVDGRPWSPENADLTFDKDTLRGFATMPGVYETVIDPKDAFEGQGALRIRRTGEDPQPVRRGPSAEERLAMAREIEARIAGSLAKYTGSGIAPRDAEWALYNARVTRQCAEMFASGGGGFAVRDRSMAENALWIGDRFPGEKVVLWAHNYHIAAIPPFMGHHLREALGKNYIAIGFTHAEGEYYAMPSGGSQKRVHALQPPVKGSVEALFREAALPLAILDLRPARAGDPGSGWARRELLFGGTIGALQTDERFVPATVGDMFDVLIYTDKTSAAKQLSTKPRRSGQ